MKNKKLWISIMAGFLAFVMIFALIASVLPNANAASSSEIKNQIDQMQGDIDSVQAQIDELEKKKQENLTEMKAMAAQKDVLDQQMGLIGAQIDTLNEQIAAYTVLIADKQEELERAQKRLAELNEKNKERIRTMEEDGGLSYWEVLFKANSFFDFLDRLNMMQEIAVSDYRRLKEMSDVAESIAVVQQELQTEKGKMEVSLTALDQKQAQINEKANEAQALLNQMKINNDEFQQYIEDAEDLADRLVDEMSQLKVEYDEAKYREWLATSVPPTTKPAGSGGSGVGGSASNISGMTWLVPCDYDRVSSVFGPRTHPITGEVGKMHNGVDLAVGCTPIYATRAGVIIANQYQEGGAGWYVCIDHGDGYRTWYMHMCDRSSVRVGQFVAAGDVIGCVGSSGGSTGSHLHFEIRKLIKGVYTPVDPMLYIG